MEGVHEYGLVMVFVVDHVHVGAVDVHISGFVVAVGDGGREGQQEEEEEVHFVACSVVILIVDCTAE